MTDLFEWENERREEEIMTITDIGSYRNDGSDTMMDGACAIAPSLKSIRERVLSLFQSGEMTDGELVSEYQKRYRNGEYRSISTRRRELVDSGMISDTGRRKKNPNSGVNNIIWALTDRAVELIEKAKAEK